MTPQAETQTGRSGSPLIEPKADPTLAADLEKILGLQLIYENERIYVFANEDRSDVAYFPKVAQA